MSAVLVPACLAAAAVAVAAGPPRAGRLRLDGIDVGGGLARRGEPRRQASGRDGRLGAERTAGLPGTDAPVPGGHVRSARRGSWLRSGSMRRSGSVRRADVGRRTGLRGAAPPGRRDAVGRRSHHVLLAAAACVATVPLAGPVLVLLAVVGAVALRAVLARRTADRGAADERRYAVEACGALAAELRAGRVPADALEVAGSVARGPLGDALRQAASGARLGGDVPTVLRDGALGSTAAPEVLRGLAACWQVCSVAGSGLATAVDRLADGGRAREAQRRQVAAALAGPRASAVMLALLPLAGVALAAGLGARPLHVLLHTPLGVGCLVLGAAMDLLGLWWTARIVARAAEA